jgi:3-oxoadipate enol-lactonase
MPYMIYKRHSVYYELNGKKGQPLIVFVNGLTQNTALWGVQTDNLNKLGYQTLTFDLLGQGKSFKPILSINFDENVDVLHQLINEVGVKQAYIAGISFGGVTALQFPLRFPEQCKGLIVMSAFTEMDQRLTMLGVNLYQGLTLVGLNMLLDLLLPINLSSQFLKDNEERLKSLRKLSLAKNDLYAVQNLMESINNFKSFTSELKNIKVPTFILNGEFDYLTPRWSHELMRQNIKNSRLVIIQHAFHAFTVEYPMITNRLFDYFVQAVENKTWKGDQSVWVATDTLDSKEVLYPCYGDHMRSIQIAPKAEVKDQKKATPVKKVRPKVKTKAVKVKAKAK